MRKIVFALIALSLMITREANAEMKKEILLPKPDVKGKTTTEEAIAKRRSKRSFKNEDLTISEIGQLLWSAQGITDKKHGLRSAPSAGALYPMEIFVLNRNGVFNYSPEEHKLVLKDSGDLRKELSAAALAQGAIAEAPLDIVIVAVYSRITAKYGPRGVRYADIEAGHIAQNIQLQATALGLGSVPIGAFNDRQVKELLNLPADYTPLYIIPVGHTR
jgi:SagB-type dehydrogenase family enzyme